MKKLMTGNEAIARGAYEAGVTFAAAYPGTPSTEILENIALYKDNIIAEWAPNEKVALESVAGASIAGARTLAAMKHVGLNVAADPFFTFAYTGVNGGAVVVTADEPGMHSSQNEQDNRNYSRHAKVALLEPSDSQEAKDMVKAGIEISEEFDTPVLLRMTTRVCHSKGIVNCCEREEVAFKKYEKNIPKYCPVPANARKMRLKVDERMKKLQDFSNNTDLNYFEWNNSKIGIIASGVAFRYAKEVFGNEASYLKLGFTNPLPMAKIKEFAEKVETLYIFEENDPFIEEQIRAVGINCIGKDKIPYIGELTPDRIREAIFGSANPTIECDTTKVVARPPALCAGCPHRGFFYELGKRKDVMVFSDIGCYSLGLANPYNATDAIICMGASISGGHGVQKVFNMQDDVNLRAISVIGDSTFFHTGIPSLLDVTYNRGNSITVILDNRITGMTGHQENPGTGYTLQGMPTITVDIETIVRACGIENVKTINPNKLNEVKDSLEWALALDKPSVIITRWPCVLKKMSKEDDKEFDAFKTKCKVDIEKCIGCKKCIKTGCPALSFNKESKKAFIDIVSCVGCEVCMQVCPVEAIVKEVK